MAPHSMEKYREALHLYATTTESVKSLARRFGFNDCSFGQFIRRQFPELHEQHQKLVRQMKIRCRCYIVTYGCIYKHKLLIYSIL